ADAVRPAVGLRRGVDVGSRRGRVPRSGRRRDRAGRGARPADAVGGPVAGGGRGAAGRHRPLPPAGDAAPVRARAPGGGRGGGAQGADCLEWAEAGAEGPGSHRLGEVVVRPVAEAWEREGDNARAALAWWLERGEAERGLRLVTALSASWLISGRHGEALRWL